MRQLCCHTTQYTTHVSHHDIELVLLPLVLAG
jgi:hypothetical protein